MTEVDGLILQFWGELFEPLNCVNMGVGGERWEQVLQRVEQGDTDNLSPKVSEFQQIHSVMLRRRVGERCPRTEGFESQSPPRAYYAGVGGSVRHEQRDTDGVGCERRRHAHCAPPPRQAPDGAHHRRGAFSLLWRRQMTWRSLLNSTKFTTAVFQAGLNQ